MRRNKKNSTQVQEGTREQYSKVLSVMDFEEKKCKENNLAVSTTITCQASA